MLCPYFFPEGARSQQPVGPILWRDPNINWTPGAQQQSYEQSCPGNPNRVTITFSRDYDRRNDNTSPPTIFPVDLLTEIGTGGQPAREILFTTMGNPPGTTNPGHLRRVRETRIEIVFDSPVSLGNFFMADVDTPDPGEPADEQWVDQVVVTANGGTLLPGSVPGTSFTGGPAVQIVGNVATGIANSPNENVLGNTAEGNVNIDFGFNLINSIEITYRNDLSTSTGIDGQISAQGITLGDISFANPCLEVTKQAGTPMNLGGGVFSIPYTLAVENTGNVTIDNVQVTENLSQALGLTLGTAPLAPGQYRVSVPPTTAAPLLANPNFNGSTDPNLLTDGSLDENQSQTINFTLEAYPTSQPIALNNNAAASGTFTPPGGITENLNDSATASVDLPPGPSGSPQIGVAKAASLPVSVGGNLFEIPYTLRVQNYGDTRLANVQVTENLEEAPPLGYGYQYVPSNPAPGQYTIVGMPSTTGTLAGNATFTGSNSGSVNLLDPTNSTLDIGQSEIVRFVVLVNPIILPTILNNQVRTSARNANNTTEPPVTDDSVNDANAPTDPNPDPDGDNNPNNNQSPTPVPLPPTPTPRIGVAKSAANVADVTPSIPNDGLFDIDYVLVVENFGNIDLANVQLVENLATQFGLTYTPDTPGIGQYAVQAPPATTAPLTANGSFTGSGANTGLLNPAGSTLAVGQRQTVTLTVRVNIDPADLPSILDNQARATGNGGGQTVSDFSNDGTNRANPNRPDPDPDGDGDPRNNEIPTRVALPTGQPIPRIGVAKESPDTAPPIIALGDGRFNIPYTILVENAGTDDLSNVQVVENFEAADPFGFGLTYVSGTPGPGQYTLIGRPSTSNPLIVNPAFTGSPGGSIELLDAANSNLAIGQRREIDFTVQVFPSSIPVTLKNQARATGTGVASQQGIRDDSVDGLNTSPDGDLDPNNNSRPTPVTLPPRRTGTGGDFVLVKRITGVTRGGQPLPGADFNRFVDDPSDNNDNQLNTTSLTPVGLANLEGLQSGDEVEYTIYYLAGGRQPVTNVRICDLVPERTAFIPNSFGGESGILLRQGTTEIAQTNAVDSDRGRFFSPLAPVGSATPPCPRNTANPNGAVFVNLGNIPNTGPNQTGFLRFRVRLD